MNKFITALLVGFGVGVFNASAGDMQTPVLNLSASTYTPGSNLTLNGSFEFDAALSNLSLEIDLALPEGWTASDVVATGGSPAPDATQISQGIITYTSLDDLTNSPINFAVLLHAPTNAAGAQALESVAWYHPGGEIDPLSVTGTPNPLLILQLTEATKLVFTTQPAASTVAGVAFDPQPAVTIQDVYGNTVTSATDTVVLTLTTGAGTLSGTASMSAVAGVANFAGKGLKIDRVGSDKVLTATSGILTNATTTPFAITVGAPSKLAITTQPVSGQSGSLLATQPVVEIQDATGNLIDDSITQVSVAIQSGMGGTLNGTKSITAVNGVLAYTDLSLAGTAGSQYVLRFAGGSLESADSGVITVTAGTATQVLVESAANGSGSVIGEQNLNSGVTLTGYAITRDAQNNFVTNVSASWSLIAREPASGGVEDGDLVVAGDNRSAIFTGALIGAAKIRASFIELPETTSGLITVLAGTAAQVRVETMADGSGSVVGEQDLISGAALTGFAISRDAASNFVANVAASAWALINKGGGVAAGDLVTNVNSKSAIFTGRLVGTAKIEASAGALTKVASGTITVRAGTATLIRVETEGGGNGTLVGAQDLVSGNNIMVFAVTRDAATNYVGTVEATWTLIDRTGGVVPADIFEAVPPYNARMTGALAGTAKIEASFGGLMSIPSGIITVTAGTANKLLITAQPSASTMTGVAFEQQPVVTIQDAAGNTATSATDTVTLALTIGTGTLGGTKTKAAVAGVADFAGLGLNINLSGDDKVLTATSGSLTPANTDPAFTITAPSTFTLTIQSDHGTANPAVGVYTNNTGSIITNSVTGTDQQGTTQYVCSSWVMTGNAPLSGAGTNFTMTVTNDATLTWNWQMQYQLATAASGNGSVDVATGFHPSGAAVVITATALTNSHFVSWSGDTNGAIIAGAVITVTMGQPLSITANFELDTFTLVGVARGNGTVVQTNTTVVYGGSTNFTVTASNYYRILGLSIITAYGTNIVDVLFDNTSTNYSFVWTNVQADGELDAHFIAQVVTNAPGNTPYWWLAKYGLNNYAVDAAADQDNDGLKTWQEYVVCTDPTNTASVLKILSVTSQAGSQTVKWLSSTGSPNYSLFYSTNLQNAVISWTLLSNNIPPNPIASTNSIIIARTNSPTFYRITVTN